jgi:hypothetical protein
MKNGVFWDVTRCGCCNNRLLEELSDSFIRVTRISELGTALAVTSNRRTLRFVRFNIFTEVTIKNAVFWDVTLCGSCKNRHFGGKHCTIIRLTRISELGTTEAGTVVSSQSDSVVSYCLRFPCSLILVNLMLEATLSSETLVFTSHMAPHPRRRCSSILVCFH